MTNATTRSLDDRIVDNLKDIAAQIYLHVSFYLIVISSKISEVADILFRWGLVNLPDGFWGALWMFAYNKASLKVVSHPSMEYKLKWAFHCGVFTIGDCVMVNINYIKLIMTTFCQSHPSAFTDSKSRSDNIADHKEPGLSYGSAATLYRASTGSTPAPIEIPVSYIYKKSNVWHRLSIDLKTFKYLKHGPPDGDRLQISGWRVILFNRIEL
jgi:hypothetical protein